MKHGSTSRRSRNNRGGGRRGNNAKTRVYDSNGPDVRIRGTSHQITEKYMNLAKDAASAGDLVLYESYLQHAEHYQRIINGWQDQIDEFLGLHSKQNGKYTGSKNPQNGSLQYPQNSYQLPSDENAPVIGENKRQTKDKALSEDVNGNLKTPAETELSDA